MKARIAKILRHPAAQVAARAMLRERGSISPVVNATRDAKRRLRAMDHRTRGKAHARLRKLGDKLYPRPWRGKDLRLSTGQKITRTFIDDFKNYQSAPDDDVGMTEFKSHASCGLNLPDLSQK